MIESRTRNQIGEERLVSGGDPMSQQPPLVLTKNIRIILGQFGIFVVLWCLTVIDYGVKSDRAPLVVSFIKDTGRSQGGLLLQLTWWLRNLSTPRPPIRPFVVLRPAMPAQPANAKLMAQTPVGKPRLRLTTMSFFPLAPVRGLAVSPIGQILASCDVTGRVCLWDAATGFSLKRLGPVGKPLECVVFT